MNYFYQLVEEDGEYGPEYRVYEARLSGTGETEISANPVDIVGNTKGDISDMLNRIQQNVAGQEPVLKDDCNLFHEELWINDEDWEVEEDFDELSPRELRF